MLLEYSVTYINATPTYICCLKIKHKITSQSHRYVVLTKLYVV